MGYMGNWLEIFKDKTINNHQKRDLIPIVEDNFRATSKFMT